MLVTFIGNHRSQDGQGKMLVQPPNGKHPSAFMDRNGCGEMEFCIN